jgi:hypothetical protein
MASGDPFVLYLPVTTTTVPYNYQPSAGTTICITSCAGINCEWYTTANAGTNFSRWVLLSNNSPQYGSANTMKVFINNTDYLHCADADLNSYGNHITGIEI